MSSSALIGATSKAPLRHEVETIGLIGLAHMVSHFCQLLLAPLFPWLKDAFDVGYVELGFLMTLFFSVSCVVQAVSGFLVDQHGPRPVLFFGLVLLAIAAFGYATSSSYGSLAFFAIVAGVGNGVFHPVDFTLINRKISATRLGHAYSFHTITGSLGWALAPVLVVPLAIAYSWRAGLVVAGLIVLVVATILWLRRDKLLISPTQEVTGERSSPPTVSAQHPLDFLRIPAVWMCFWFFLLFATALSVVQAFAPEAARQLHGMPAAWVALCLTLYMVSSAAGTVVGGFLVTDPRRCERIIAVGFGVAALVAVTVALAKLPPVIVPALFAVMGFSTGMAGPSRDLIVKRTTPKNATGRVYGIVYSGLDIGQAIGPLIFGLLMDRNNYQGVWLGLVLTQIVLIGSTFAVSKSKRDAVN